MLVVVPCSQVFSQGTGEVITDEVARKRGWRRHRGERENGWEEKKESGNFPPPTIITHYIYLTLQFIC